MIQELLSILLAFGESPDSRFVLRRAFPSPVCWVKVASCAFVHGHSCDLQSRIFTGFLFLRIVNFDNLRQFLCARMIVKSSLNNLIIHLEHQKSTPIWKKRIWTPKGARMQNQGESGKNKGSAKLFSYNSLTYTHGIYSLLSICFTCTLWEGFR
jgi:hypothetical protein